MSMAEIVWATVFERLDQGESAAAIAKELQVDRSTVWRKYQAHLESQVAGKRHELAQLQGTVERLNSEFQRKKAALVAAFGKDEQELKSRLQSLKEKLTSLSAEYARKRTSKEQELAGALGGAQEELAKTQSQVSELRKAASGHKLTIEQALGLLAKIKDLGGEISARQHNLTELSREIRDAQVLKTKLQSDVGALKSQLSAGRVVIAGMQSSYAALSNWNVYERPQLENYRGWLESTVAKLEAKKQDDIKITEELSKEIGAKEKVSGGLNATLEKTRVDLNETAEKLSGATTDLIKIRGKSDEEVEVSQIRVQATLISALAQAEEILKGTRSQREEILRDTIAKKEELEREVSKLEGEIAELKKKREDLESNYERKAKIVGRRLNEIKEAWTQMAREAESKGMVLPSLGF